MAAMTGRVSKLVGVTAKSDLEIVLTGTSLYSTFDVISAIAYWAITCATAPDRSHNA